MKQVIVPNFGFDFLRMAKEYATQKNTKNKLDQAIKIVIFTVAAIEAIANHEARETMSDSDSNKFIWDGSSSKKVWPKKDRRSAIVKKWDILLEGVSFTESEKLQHLIKLTNVVDQRNQLIHFKPQENRTEIKLLPKKNKVIGPNGKLYTAFRKTGFKVSRNGIINQINLTSARNDYKNIDELIFEYLKKKNLWPNPKFVNEHWLTRSPFWKDRKRFN